MTAGERKDALQAQAKQEDKQPYATEMEDRINEQIQHELRNDRRRRR
jgi:hypothetical protein